MTDGDHTGQGRAIRVAWQSPGEKWGIQAAAQYDQAVNRDFDAVLKPGGRRWEDERRTSGTVTVFWQPIQFATGDLTHSIRVRGGPSVQREQGEDFKLFSSVREGRLEEEARLRTEESTDNTYLLNRGDGMVLFQTQSVDRTAFGPVVGLSYGLTYSPVTVRLDLSSRSYGNDIGGTHEIGLALEVQL